MNKNDDGRFYMVKKEAKGEVAREMKKTRKLILLQTMENEFDNAVKEGIKYTANFIWVRLHCDTVCHDAVIFKDMDEAISLIRKGAASRKEERTVLVEKGQYIAFCCGAPLENSSEPPALIRNIDLFWMYGKLYGYGLRVERFSIWENTAFLCMNDAQERNTVGGILDLKENEAAADQQLLIPLNGLGDYFIFHSLLTEYANVHGGKIWVPRIGGVPATMLDCYYPSIPKLTFDNDATLILCQNIMYENVIPIAMCLKQYFTTMKHKAHIFDIMEGLLQVRCKPYQHASQIENSFAKSFSKQRREELDQYMGYIGVQLMIAMLQKNANIQANDRSWDEARIREFDSLCHEAEIKVISISPLPIQGLHMEIMDDLTTEEYVYLVSRLRLIIGMDSSGGHIASFFDVPSITIWKKHAFTLESTYKRSYRPLRKNISLYSDEARAQCITPRLVFDVMQKFLNGEIDVEESEYNSTRNLFYVKCENGCGICDSSEQSYKDISDSTGAYGEILYN